LPSAANARRSRRMASSDTRNSFARAVALTGRPRSSRLSISFFLIAPDEPCTNKKLPCTIKKHNRSTLQRRSAYVSNVKARGIGPQSVLQQIWQTTALAESDGTTLPVWSEDYIVSFFWKCRRSCFERPRPREPVKAYPVVSGRIDRPLKPCSKLKWLLPLARILMVARDGIEPPTPAFSGPRSTTELSGLG
jgi:hypothetical protein